MSSDPSAPPPRRAIRSYVVRAGRMGTGQQRALAELAPLARRMGYDGLELACWGDHFDVQQALASETYVEDKWALLREHGLSCLAIGNHLVARRCATSSTNATAPSCRRTFGAMAIPKACASAQPASWPTPRAPPRSSA